MVFHNKSAIYLVLFNLYQSCICYENLSFIPLRCLNSKELKPSTCTLGKNICLRTSIISSMITSYWFWLINMTMIAQWRDLDFSKRILKSNLSSHDPDLVALGAKRAGLKGQRLGNWPFYLKVSEKGKKGLITLSSIKVLSFSIYPTWKHRFKFCYIIPVKKKNVI